MRKLILLPIIAALGASAALASAPVKPATTTTKAHKPATPKAVKADKPATAKPGN
jgi:hypothetical protein